MMKRGLFMKYTKITACLDMYGCPNRCKHCWLGCTPNGNLPGDELYYVSEQFLPFTDCLQMFNWYREPDYKDDYKEMWDLCKNISDKSIVPTHFELISVWRIVRDAEYVKWLSSLGLKIAQLTVFGSEQVTDFYTGRKGAYQEILNAIDILIDNKISPRIQTFVNKTNIGELVFIEKLINDLDLENRCKSFGGEFSFFLHQGSCDGENEQFYNVRLTPDDMVKIPQILMEYTLNHFGKNNIIDVFGKTEQSLFKELLTDTSTLNYVSETPVFYIDKDFNVYPNETAPAPHWCLGNLKMDGPKTILGNYRENKSVAQKTRLNVPLCKIVKSQGDPTSQRLFSKGDYITFMLNKYCRIHETF